MYSIEIYANEPIETNKVGLQELLTLHTFDAIFKGIIRNNLLYLCYTPLNNKNCIGFCNLGNYKAYTLKRQGLNYVLQITVLSKDLKTLQKEITLPQAELTLRLIR